MLRSALRWLRIDQNDQIAASSMRSCVVLARSYRRPAGVELCTGHRRTWSRWKKAWTISFAQDGPQLHHGIPRQPGHSKVHTQQETSRRPQPLATHTRQPHTLNHRAHLTQSRRDLPLHSPARSNIGCTAAQRGRGCNWRTAGWVVAAAQN